jgi:hypothetical protein
MRPALTAAATVLVLALCGCSPRSSRTYTNTAMDFGSIRSVAVLPFWNLSKDPQGADRVRDVFTNALLATNAVYVIPTGEVARAVSRLNIATPVTPTSEEVVKLAGMLKVDAVITGVEADSANDTFLSFQRGERVDRRAQPLRCEIAEPRSARIEDRSRLEIQVRHPATTQCVSLAQLRRWVDGIAVSPDETLKKRKLKALLAGQETARR